MKGPEKRIAAVVTSGSVLGSSQLSFCTQQTGSLEHSGSGSEEVWQAGNCRKTSRYEVKSGLVGCGRSFLIRGPAWGSREDGWH